MPEINIVDEDFITVAIDDELLIEITETEDIVVSEIALYDGGGGGGEGENFGTIEYLGG